MKRGQLGIAGYTHIIEHSVFLENDRYLGNKGTLNAAYNRQFGDVAHGGERIIMYWDADRNWMGWSFMFDRVTGIGKVIDGYPVFWRWEIAPPNHAKGETHRGKSTWCFSVPATTEFDLI